MTLLYATAVGTLFGSGAYLLLKSDLFRIVIGMALIANAANLALIASGVQRGVSPILPLEGEQASDPLVQALTLTAIVIGFATIALLLALVERVHSTHGTVDLDELSHAEASQEHELERESD